MSRKPKKTNKPGTTAAVKSTDDEIVIIVDGQGSATRLTDAELLADAYESQLTRKAKTQVIGQREKYADAALGVFQAWVGFTIVFIITQFVLTALGSPMETSEFIAVVVTSAGSTVGLAYMVGKFLFPADGTKGMFK